jgi:hypothetical protein
LEEELSMPAFDSHPTVLDSGELIVAVLLGTASGIGQFYKEVMQAPYTLTQDMHAATTKVKVGPSQCVIFRETNEEIPDYDGHHLAVSIANFSGPHRWLKKHGLDTEESSAYQYRFGDIVHPETGRKLFAIEHEVRSFTHPMRGRDAFVSVG